MVKKLAPCRPRRCRTECAIPPRGACHDCLYTRADALFELTDAVPHPDGPVKTLVELS